MNNNKTVQHNYSVGAIKYKHSPSLFQRVYTKDKLLLPDGWASYNVDNNAEGRTILFSQLGIRNDKPAMMRQVILFEDLSLRYFVGKHRVNLEISTCPVLPTILKMEADIEPAISAFTTVKICQGRGKTNGPMYEFSFDEELGGFYHAKCQFILSKREDALGFDTCDFCRERNDDEDVVFLG